MPFNYSVSPIGITTRRQNALRAFLASGARSIIESYSSDGQGFSMDFTKQRGQVYIQDSGTPANDVNTSGAADFDEFNSTLTYTSPSPKMVMQSDGTIKYAAHNLATYSGADIGWTAGGTTPPAIDGDVEFDGYAGVSVEFDETTDQGFSGSRVRGTNYNITSDVDYTVSFVVKFSRALTGSEQVLIYSTGVYGGAVLNVTSSDDYTSPTEISLSMTPNTSGNNGLAIFQNSASISSSVTVYIAKYSVRRSPSNEAFLSTNGTARYALPIDGDNGLLVEPQATNLLTYSTALDNATGGWSEQQASPTPNYAVAPDGTTTATRLIDDASTGTGVVDVNKTVVVATSTEHTVSVYAKSDQLSWLAIAARFFTTPADGYSYFDLSSGSVGTAAAGHTLSISDVGDGWYRCSVKFTTDGTDATGVVYFHAADSDGDHIVNLDGTSSILLWNAQLETGSVATSPIITSGSTVTRAADNLTIATSAFPYADAAGGGAIWGIRQT